MVLGEDHSYDPNTLCNSGDGAGEKSSNYLIPSSGHTSITAVIDRFSNNLDVLLTLVQRHS